LFRVHYCSCYSEASLLQPLGSAVLFLPLLQPKFNVRNRNAAIDVCIASQGASSRDPAQGSAGASVHTSTWPALAESRSCPQLPHLPAIVPVCTAAVPYAVKAAALHALRAHYTAHCRHSSPLWVRLAGPGGNEAAPLPAGGPAAHVSRFGDSRADRAEAPPRLPARSGHRPPPWPACLPQIDMVARNCGTLCAGGAGDARMGARTPASAIRLRAGGQVACPGGWHQASPMTRNYPRWFVDVLDVH